MKKLSKAQRVMLTRMAEGEHVAVGRMGVDTWAFYHGRGDRGLGDTAHQGTLWALRSRRYVEDIEPDWRGGTYAITDAGRAALDGCCYDLPDCRNCGGDGYTTDTPRCPACNGSGVRTS